MDKILHKNRPYWADNDKTRYPAIKRTARKRLADKLVVAKDLKRQLNLTLNEVDEIKKEIEHLRRYKNIIKMARKKCVLCGVDYYADKKHECDPVAIAQHEEYKKQVREMNE